MVRSGLAVELREGNARRRTADGAHAGRARAAARGAPSAARQAALPAGAPEGDQGVLGLLGEAESRTQQIEEARCIDLEGDEAIWFGCHQAHDIVVIAAGLDPLDLLG